MSNTEILAARRWFVPPIALGNMVATIILADQGGWSGGTVASAIAALSFAVLTGALWADREP
ncbi:MAG: hypothetical protein ACOYXM_00985 [Actinomycetota bacterium]